MNILQYRRFETEFDLFVLKPGMQNNDFCALVTFMSNVAFCYPDVMSGFPAKVMNLLELHDAAIHPRVRLTLAQALVLCRNRGLVLPVPLLTLFFKLFRIHDKTLRKLLFGHIIADITHVNANGTNQKVNRSLQNFMFTMLEDRSETAARKSLDVIVELYRRRVWLDARTVNVLATACLSDKMKVSVGALRFFLGIEERMEELEEEEKKEEEKRLESGGGNVVIEKIHSKKTRAKAREILQARKKMIKGKKQLANKAPEPRFPAIDLVYDPQGFVEKLFKKLKNSNDRFEMRIMMMNLISRFIGHHKLIVLNFYSFLQRYLNSHQEHITKILACLVQACHPLVPPEEMIVIIKTIANNFVTERNNAETMAVGINAIREIFVRIPLTLEEDGMQELVHDLVQYSSYLERGVRSSARSLVNLLREIFPSILKRKDRGKFNAGEEKRPAAFGDRGVKFGVDGAELLEEEEEILREAGINPDERDDEEDGWEVATESEDSEEDGWVDVSNSEEEEEEEDNYVAERIEKHKKKLQAKHAQESAESGSEDSEEEEEEEDESDLEEDGGEENADGDKSEEEQELDEEDNEGWVKMDVSDDDEEEDDDDEEEEEEEEEEGEEGESDEEEEEAAVEPSSKKKSLKRKERESDNDKSDTEEDGQGDSKRFRVDQRRILTPADFARIEALKKRQGKFAEKGIAGPAKSSQAAKERESVVTSAEEVSAVVEPTDLESFHKRRRRDLEERLKSVAEGREEFEHKKKGGGTTNAEKRRKKNFNMVKKSQEVRSKLTRSLKDQNNAINKRIKKMAKEGKKLNRRRL
jgi:protein SDA1